MPDSIGFLLLIPTGKKDLVEEPMFYFKIERINNIDLSLIEAMGHPLVG